MADFLGLAGKSILVFGVANKKSVAYHVARTVEEAGGKVTGMDGKSWVPEDGHILATNGLIHDEVLRIIS